MYVPLSSPSLTFLAPYDCCFPRQQDAQAASPPTAARGQASPQTFMKIIVAPRQPRCENIVEKHFWHDQNGSDVRRGGVVSHLCELFNVCEFLNYDSFYITQRTKYVGNT